MGQTRSTIGRPFGFVHPQHWVDNRRLSKCGASGIGGSRSTQYNCAGGGGGYFGGGAGCPAGGGSSYSKGTILYNVQGDSRCVSDGALFIRISKCVTVVLRAPTQGQIAVAHFAQQARTVP
jgi:hypothetical protein